MTILYNCKHSGNQFRITKFTSDFEVEASYLLDATTCECPAGHRPTCRHRQMLPKFIARNAIDTEWFFDHDRGGWVQGWKEEPVLVIQQYNASDDTVKSLFADELISAALPIQSETEPSLTILTEVRLPDDATPDQVAEAFGNLLVAPFNLTSTEIAERESALAFPSPDWTPQLDAMIKIVESIDRDPRPSPSSTIRRRI